MVVTSRRASPVPRSQLLNEFLLTTYRIYNRIRFALLIEGRLPETVHRRSEVWRPAVRLVIACSGGTGPARQALRPVPRGARCTRCGGNAADGSADPEPKNRHGGAPRGERPTSLDARRLASAWHAASSHAERMRSAASVRLSALRPPFEVGVQFHHPGRNRASGMRCAVRTGCFIL